MEVEESQEVERSHSDTYTLVDIVAGQDVCVNLGVCKNNVGRSVRPHTCVTVDAAAVTSLVSARVVLCSCHQGGHRHQRPGLRGVGGGGGGVGGGGGSDSDNGTDTVNDFLACWFGLVLIAR